MAGGLEVDESGIGESGAIPAFWGRGDEGTGLRVNGRVGGAEVGQRLMSRP